MFNTHDITRNEFMLHGPLAHHGYDWWWHSFTAQDALTGEDKPFFIEFFVCNPALAEDKPVFGQLPENKAAGRKPSYLMVKAGTWGEDHCQLHRFFAWKDVDLHAKAPYSVAAADCLASENRLMGSIQITAEDAQAHSEWMCDAGEMSWDLTIDKQIAFNVGYGASKPLRDAEAFAMYWHAEGMKSAYSGKITLNGREYVVVPEKSYGYADKNWGRDFTSPWVWLSSNCLYSKKTGQLLENSVFDIGGGRPKIYFVPLNRRLLGVFYYEGKEYDFNFSKLHLMVKTEFSFEENKDIVTWHVRQENLHAVMETEVHCRKKDMLLVNYEAPDGSKHHNKLWNGGNGWGTVKLYDKTANDLSLVDEIEATHIGCEYGEYDTQ
ncbi:MAG: tocopherol cyclase family protein [Acetatifactor sp.]|nr:tocopherol cyclase family protein [Acetatifactor sp.]